MPHFQVVLWDRIDIATLDTLEEAKLDIAGRMERKEASGEECPYTIRMILDEDFRLCAICGKNHISSPNPEVDFCRSCYSVGSHEERRFSELLGRLEDLPNVASTPSIWNSGGGCWILEFELSDGRVVWATNAFEEGGEWHVDAGTPENVEGPWSVCVGKNRDAFDGEHEDEIVTHIPVYSAAFPDLISNFS